MLDRVSAFMQVYAHTISFKNLFATYQIFLFSQSSQNKQ